MNQPSEIYSIYFALKNKGKTFPLFIFFFNGHKYLTFSNWLIVKPKKKKKKI